MLPLPSLLAQATIFVAGVYLEKYLRSTSSPPRKPPLPSARQSHQAYYPHYHMRSDNSLHPSLLIQRSMCSFPQCWGVLLLPFQSIVDYPCDCCQLHSLWHPHLWKVCTTRVKPLSLQHQELTCCNFFRDTGTPPRRTSFPSMLFQNCQSPGSHFLARPNLFYE